MERMEWTANGTRTEWNKRIEWKEMKMNEMVNGME